MNELKETKINNGKTEHTFLVDVVVSKEKTFTDDQLTDRKAKLETRKQNLTESLAKIESELDEINSLIALT